MSQPTPLAALASLAEQLERTSSRLELAGLVADFLRQLQPDEIAPAVRLLIGQVFPLWDGRALNLSWAVISQVVKELAPVDEATRRALAAEAVDGGQMVWALFERGRPRPEPPALTLQEVYRTFGQIANTTGRGSRPRKEGLLRGLLVHATPTEAKVITKVILADMRHGVNEGLVLDAIARAVGVKPTLVRRANQLTGDVGETAQVALTGGENGLKSIPLRLGRPLQPMLAQTAESVAEALARHGGQAALEYKLDGARVQIHKDGDVVRIFSRQLSDVTASLPEVVTEVRAGLRARSAIVEGEVIAVDAAGRPLPFQHLMRRFRRVHDVEAMAREVPVELILFDCLYRDGESLLDTPHTARWAALETVAGPVRRVERLVTANPDEGTAFARRAAEAGHEGVMAKRLDSRYTPGVRGKFWFKIKHAISLDLAIVAAEWGYGRRHGWLSNYHLAGRDEETGEFWVVGKTFKGLTDQEFEAMTRRLLELKQWERGSVVGVLPKVVVEVQFNEIQQSTQYPSGLALRFARITRIRDDKSPAQADTIQTLRALFERQFETKGLPASLTGEGKPSLGEGWGEGG
jgi:DNA ligase-1